MTLTKQNIYQFYLMMVRKVNKLIKSMKNSLKYMLPENLTTRVTYLRTKLSNKFTKIREKTAKEQ